MLLHTLTLVFGIGYMPNDKWRLHAASTQGRRNQHLDNICLIYKLLPLCSQVLYGM
jgi:hypothetical protein